MNYQFSVNLLRYKVARVMNISGKMCVVLPIEDNDLYAHTDDTGRISDVYLTCAAWETREPGRYGDTHYLKQSHSKERREAMSAEERRAEPILGNMRPIEMHTPTSASVPSSTTPPQAEPINWDAPF
jgi:hypothetical protein